MRFGTNSGTYGLTEKFNYAHYARVLEARRAAGLPVKVYANLDEHPLFRKKVVKHASGTVYVIDHVHEAWNGGFYYYATARNVTNNSQIGLVIGNRNSKAPEVLALLAEFEFDFHLVN